MPRRPGPGLVQATRMPHNDRMEDSKMKARILEDATAYAGFFKLRRLVVEHDRFDGGTTGPLVREVLHRSDAAAALLYDPAADKVVMIEEYRAHPVDVEKGMRYLLDGLQVVSKLREPKTA